MSRERFGNKSDRSGGAKTRAKAPATLQHRRVVEARGERAQRALRSEREEHQVPDGRVL
jgi:hypothetical protein